MTEGAQTRLAAIISADVVGSSRLMGEDEAGRPFVFGDAVVVREEHDHELQQSIIKIVVAKKIGYRKFKGT